MKETTGSIALVGFDESSAQSLSTQLNQSASIEVEAVPSPLSAINGHAVKLSRTHDVVLFQTDADSGTDLEALHTLRTESEKGATIIALTNADASLAATHKLSRAGADQILPDSISIEELQEVVQSCFAARIRVEPQIEAHRGHVITVTQSRGGAGATTVAVNVADALLDKHGMIHKEARKSVVIVDLDLQFGAVSGFLDVERNDALYQIARDGIIPDATFLDQSVVKTEDGLSVLPAPASIAPMDALKREQVSAIIETLSKTYDYVVVDLPRVLVDWISPVIELTDKLLLVTDTTVPSIQQARRLIDFYTEDNLNLPIDIVINHEKRPMMKAPHHKEASKVLERPFDIWLPDDPKAARDALDRGIPLSAAAGRSALTKGFRKLGRTLATTLESSSRNSKTARQGA